MDWFSCNEANSLEFVRAAKAQGRPIVGIMCEFTPRELVFAAGGVPVCLCGGDLGTIAPAEEHLPANLCPLIKSTYGYLVTGTNPFLSMADLVIAETTCDGKKKMYELMAESVPMHVLELPQKQADEDARSHWEAEVRKLRGVLEKRFSVSITDDRLREGIRVMNRERALRRDLAALMRSESPPLTGRQLLEYRSMVSGIPTDMARFAEALSRLRGGKSDPSLKDRTRVLLTGVPTVRGAEKVLDLIEDHGGLIVCQENCTGVKPIVEDVDERASDPLDAIARKYFHLPCSVMTSNDRRLELLRQLVAQYRPQCVVELIWQACITYDVESYKVKRLAEVEFGVPYLRIETDYSPLDSPRIAVRVEALFETVKRTAWANSRETHWAKADNRPTANPRV